MKFTVLFLLLLNIPFLIYGIKTPQKNPEELFLSDEYQRQIKVDQKLFEGEELVFVSSFSKEDSQKLEEFLGEQEIPFSNLSMFTDGLGVMELGKRADEENIVIFEKIRKEFPHLTFAGDSYTNMHLALMTKKIQDLLFPVIFFIIFLGLIFLTKNLLDSLYLFLSSLLGSSIGLSAVKILFSHSTILTTLTPLIGFVLTLGIQFHVLYGFKAFQTRALFFRHKLRPILLMMITTIIGFLSLMSSNLESIRQLSLATSLTLLLTWGIAFIVISFFPISTKEEINKDLARSSFDLSLKSSWAYLLLVCLICGGIFAIKNMPILVDAVHFFPKTHEIQVGHIEISDKLKGTPQFEIILQKKDDSEFDFQDYQELYEIEKFLKKKFGNDKILSVNQLVKQANLIYSQNENIPDNSYAYEALFSKVPSLISKNLRSSNALKFIFLEKSLSGETRKELSKEMVIFLQNSLPDYQVRSSGLMHFLLLSQENLVTTLIKSFALSFLSIVFIFAFINRNKKDLLNFSLINLSSVLGGLFFMWPLGMTLNISTVMTVSISMGLVVDSTIHLMYASKLKEIREVNYLSTIKPIILSHIVLLGAFSVLSFESFLPIGDFAKGLLILLALGLILDLYILPLINKN